MPLVSLCTTQIYALASVHVESDVIDRRVMNVHDIRHFAADCLFKMIFIQLFIADQILQL